MSSKAAAQHRDDEDDEEDDGAYEQGDEEEEDDDDEEDEAEFVPGVDEEEDDEEDEEVVPLFDGTLSLDDAMKLHYQGDGFNLVSTEPVPWNVLDSSVKPEEQTFSFQMQGPCVVHDEEAHRRLEITWTAEDASNIQGNGKMKSIEGKYDDDDQGGKKVAPVFYKVYGREVEREGEQLEIQGFYHPSNGKEVNLLCQVRVSSPTTSVAAVASPVAAVAGGRYTEDNRDDDEDEDEDDNVDFDEVVDHDELIALYEDQHASPETLKKRYIEEGTKKQPPNKKAKPSQDEGDDDDEYGF